MSYLTLKNFNNTDAFGRLFDDLWAPAAAVEEENDHFLLSLEIPGIKRENIKIEALGDKLVISGERKNNSKNGLYSEQRTGSFQRTFTLPSQVDTSKIEAQYEDGILNVFVPKAEAAKSRQIKIGDSATPAGFFSRQLKSEGTESRSA